MKHTAFAELSSQVKRDEGFRATPYKCTAGKLTIGYGLNLDAGITDDEAAYAANNNINFWESVTEAQAAYVLEKRLNSIVDDMERFNWYSNLGDARRVVVCNMVYQLGITRFLKFKKMIAALEEKNFSLAADEMKNSAWYHQTTNRAERLIEKMKRGVLYA